MAIFVNLWRHEVLPEVCQNDVFFDKAKSLERFLEGQKSDQKRPFLSLYSGFVQQKCVLGPFYRKSGQK